MYFIYSFARPMRQNKFLLYLVCLFSIAGIEVATAQIRNKPGTELSIRKASGIIKLDGVLDEPDWQQAAGAKDFFLNYPVDSIPPAFQTEARLTFDQHFLYVSFVCYDDQKPSVMQSLRRDFDFILNDNVGICIDPYNDYTNGFFFVVSPYGVQLEGTISGGGSFPESFNGSWDN